MKERPILFSAPMVRAILEGRKTQTRRVMKKQPNIDPQTGDWLIKNSDGSEEVEPIERWIKIQKMLHCPYGQPGDRLWVRETWKRAEWPTGYPYEYRATAEADGTPTDGPWKSPIYMPREAARIVLEITYVRAERLLAISESDALSEGVELWPDGNYKNYGKVPGKYQYARDSFLSLWDIINGDVSNADNPWVWVIEFKEAEQ